MTRIATAQANLNTLNQLLRNQSELVSAQNDVATGKKATDLKGLVKELGTLNAARAVISRSESIIQRIDELEPRLAVQDQALGQLAGVADDIRQSLIGSLGLDDGLNIINNLEASVSQLAISLNEKFAGRSLFGGTKVGGTPFRASTLDEIGAAANVADLFNNSDVRQVSRIDDGALVETGFLASEVAGELVTIIKAIKDFNDGAGGPFTRTITAAQRSFIEAQLVAISPALDALHQVQGKNGLLQARLDSAKVQEEDRQILLIGVIGDLEDIDLAEAASRLTQAQTAVEASARTFNVLSNTSLLNFLS
ncbi:MAG: hypothetical protein JKX99_09680 [Robiginitomaculum sp.]|nr:hypothetical protein [Robiginitomaculum sp.]